MLHIEPVIGPEALGALAAEWDLLDSEIHPRTPFTSPLWISLWWKHFRRNRAFIKDEFFCHTLRDRDGRLVAIAPLMVTHAPGVGPVRIRLLQFFGADPSLTEYRGVICRADRQDEVITALAKFLLERKDCWDVLWWTGIRSESSTYDALAGLAELIEDSELADYVLPMPKTWDKLRAGVSSNTRKNIRKAYEFLERDGHAFTFRAIEKPDAVSAALEHFFRLHAARANASDMTIDHPDRFANPRHRRFLVEYVQRVAERGLLRLFEIEIDGQVIASRLAFLLDSELYFYFAGYDPNWRKYSVMTTLMSEALKWAIDHRVKIVNLSTGKDLSKMRWRPCEIVHRSAVQIAPTIRGRLGFTVYDLLVRRPRLRTLQRRTDVLRLKELGPAAPAESRSV
jgi:CelD/BcsL family acetyltransferase involved in cellulose biosynthesis